MPVKTLDTILKQYDEYIAFADEPRERHYFPSGILALNYIIDDNNPGKGIPGGSIVQLLGEAKNGKSTLSLDYIAQAQKTGIVELKIGGRAINAAIIDFEHSFDPNYAVLIGVDISKLLVVTPKYAEEGFDIAEALVNNGLQMIVIDSVGMLVTQSEEDKSNDDSEKVGSEAKALGRFLKRINALADLADALIIVINQYRANLSSAPHAPDKKPYGARQLQYIAKATIKVARISNKDGKTEIEFFIEKTKMGAEGRKGKFSLIFGQGIDYDQHILTLANAYGMIQKKSSWYSYGDYKSQGLDNAGDNFPMDEIREKVIAALQGE
jgi:recombination protein RecA